MNERLTAHRGRLASLAVLYLPFGMLTGAILVGAVFKATKDGMSPLQAATLVAGQIGVSWIKWIWAPLVDIAKSLRATLLIANLIATLLLIVLFNLPLRVDDLYLLITLIILANIANSVSGMAVEAITAHSLAKNESGDAGAWLQAGALGGSGFAGAACIFLLENCNHFWISSAIFAGFSVCMLPLLWLPAEGLSPAENKKSISAQIFYVLKKLGKILTTRKGILTAALCLLPIGTGAAQALFVQAKVVEYWHATSTQVALVQGLSAGALTIAGCFVGGWLCTRFGARNMYVVFGLILSSVAAWMAETAPVPINYVCFSLVYAFVVGLCYAAFSAMALAIIGHTAAASGYNTFASLANFPVWWLGLLLGYLIQISGPRAMLLVEASVGLGGILIFYILSATLQKKSGLKINCR